MQDKERIQHISELMNKFYKKMESIMRSPGSTSQEDGISLYNDVNKILEEFDALENPEGMKQYRVQFELVRRRLQQAMMTNKPEE